MAYYVELFMIGAIAGVDSVTIDSMDATSANSNVRQNYMYSYMHEVFYFNSHIFSSLYFLKIVGRI